MIVVSARKTDTRLTGESLHAVNAEGKHEKALDKPWSTLE